MNKAKISRIVARVGRRVAVVAVALAGLSVLGCSQTNGMFDNYAADRTFQVQFYSPEDAKLVLCNQSGHAMVASRGPLGDRLEHRPEEFAVYDLLPGRYEFAYTQGEGVGDAAIYGELEILRVPQGYAEDYRRTAFLPVRLPSLQRQLAEHLVPSRDLSYTIGLEDREFQHLRQGDMLTRAYFIADLDRVREEHDIDYYQEINDVDRALTVLADREEYLTVRYDEARRRALFRNPELNINDKIAYDLYDGFGVEEEYIVLSRKLQSLGRERESLQLERDRLKDERGRRNALLRSMRIEHRAGALVLATPDLTRPYTDVVEQAGELGEVVAVLRVGGRHQYWAMGLLAAGGGDMAFEEAETEMIEAVEP